MSSRSRASANPVSLFPFLAVLICTMGTLILLLIIITKLAKSQQETNIQVMDQSQEIEEMEYETAMAESMTNDLAESKKQTELEIENERAKMAVLEKQIEKLASEIEQTLTFLEQRGKNQAEQNQETETLQKRLELKQSELATLEEEYRQLQKQHGDGKRSYAIVPYRGPNGTFKRPIYIECTYDKVILQPEGIVFSEMDFVLASHPDNPLDAGIRAVYQYYLERGLIEQGSEPYPLVLVRPRGIDAYYAVRNAISSWNDNFGYELVEEDWKLEFPEANPELKNEIAKRVEIARLRLQPVFESLMAREMRMQGLGHSNRARDGMNSPVAGTGRGSMSGTSAGTGTGAATGTGTGTGTGSGASLSGNSLFENDLTGLAALQNGNENNGSGMSAGNESGNATGGAAGNAAGNDPGYGGGDCPISAQQGEYAGQTGDNGMQQNAGQSHHQRGSGSASASEGFPMNDLFIRTEHDDMSAENAAGNGKITMEQIWGSQNSSVQTAPKNPAYAENFDSSQRRPFQPFYEPESPKNVASNNQWGAHRPGMTPIGRNIPLICSQDKLAFTRSAGKGFDREIAVSRSVHDVSGEFADTVWKYIETWGDAGSSMYWRPTLKVTVTPGAEPQFEQLKMMLNGSGLKVERTQ